MVSIVMLCLVAHDGPDLLTQKIVDSGPLLCAAACAAAFHICLLFYTSRVGQVCDASPDMVHLFQILV
jgi:hypothetical protein